MSSVSPAVDVRASVSLADGRADRRESDDQLDEVVQRRADGSGAAGAPMFASVAPAGGGDALPAHLRGPLESSTGADLGAVRVHTDGHAEATAEGLSARAFTHGEDISFAPGAYAPDTAAGRHLIAHEVAHTVQQDAGGAEVARKPDAAGPAVSDPADASEREADHFADAFVEGRPATAALSRATVSRQTVSRFAAAAMGMHAAAAPAMTRRGGGTYEVVEGDTLSEIAARVYGKASYWKELRDANPGRVQAGGHLIKPGTVLDLPELDIPMLEAMQALDREQERIHDTDLHRGEELRDLAVSMSAQDYERFLAEMSPKERQQNMQLLQNVELMRATGMTFEEMAEAQRAYMEAEALSQGKTVGEYVRDYAHEGRLSANAFAAEDWASVPKPRRDEWTRRATRVFTSLRRSAPEEIRQAIHAAESIGGGFVFAPEEIDPSGAFSDTLNSVMRVGREFIETFERDPSSVHANVLHEFAGHQAYAYGQRTPGQQIMRGALALESQEERDVANTHGKQLFIKYGYLETEMFAELYEWKYDTTNNATDPPFPRDPAGEDATLRPVYNRPDIPRHLAEMQASFEPRVAEGLIRAMWLRVTHDETIVAKAKSMFRDAVATILGIEL